MGGLVGKRLGRYEIVSLLGSGGMGEVYRARDDRLGREVAIKVLRQQAGHQHSPARFEREARLAAQLSHPNIVELHDFGLSDDIPYAVMELLHGESLRNRLQSRKMSIAEAVEIGSAVADGLAVAHEAGIVHRDIKPGNIFLTKSGHVKILDFGIARPTAEAAAPADPKVETITGPGAIVGTTPFMSPEQIRGDQVDGRSDIFSLGCVLYEMITGSSPFARDNQAKAFSAILTEDPPAPSSCRPDVPGALDEIVSRCIRKEPDDRFDSVRDVAFALRATIATGSGSRPTRSPLIRSDHRWLRLASAAVAVTGFAIAGIVIHQAWGAPQLPEHHRLAVLRFEAPSSNQAVVRMAAGLSEDLASKIALLEREGPGLDWVLGRSASGDRSPERLDWMRTDRGVNLALEGRLENTDDGLRLDLELTDAESGRILRRSTIEGAAGNPGSLQVEPVMAVASMLDIEAGAVIRDRLRERITNVTGAWPAYLDGSGRLAIEGGEGASEALLSLGKAINDDPLFPAARLEAARAWLQEFENNGDASCLDRGLAEAQHVIAQGNIGGEAARVAAALHSAAGDEIGRLEALEQGKNADPEDGQVRLELGLALKEAGRLEEAENELRRSIYLRPGYWPAHHWLGELEVEHGQYDAAATEFRRVVELVPEYAEGYTALAVPLLYLNRNDEARRVLERAIELKAEVDYTTFSNLGSLFFYEARFADASAMYERALEIEPDDSEVWGNLGWARDSAGETEKAGIAFRRAIELAEEERKTGADNIPLAAELAGYYGAVGDPATGLDVLDTVDVAGLEDPETVALVAETYEDLGDRDRALEWVERALSMGVPPERFTKHPSLRNLAADSRFGENAGHFIGAPGDQIRESGGR